MSKLNPEQFAGSGPSPTREDAFITVGHLSDAIGWNIKHGTSHFMSLRKHIERGSDSKTLMWHLEHTAKHYLEAKEHSEKLAKHVSKHPAFRQSVQEIRAIDPMKYGAQ